MPQTKMQQKKDKEKYKEFWYKFELLLGCK